MRLRTQLGLFCTVMAGIVLAFGLLGYWGGSQVVKSFSTALQDMKRVSQIQSLQVLLARQKASLDAYFLVTDPQELDRFQEMSRIVNARIKDAQAASPDDQALKEVGEEYNAALDLAREVIELYKVDKHRAFRQASDVLLPKVTGFLDDVNKLQVRMEGEVLAAQRDVNQLVSQSGRWVIYLVLLGAMAGFFFAVSTFRSLTKSLRLLQEGTAAFGSGQWDFRIGLTTKDELGDLARSFNEMAQNIKQLETQTVHMHRMSAVGQLAGGVAHEINNPLTGVLGQAQLLLEKLPSADPHRSHIEKIERAAVRCKRIVRSLLDFSRQKESQFTYLNVNEIVEATLELCEPDLQSNHVAVIKNLNLAIPSITGNSSQLQQVFLNLATNAIQAMPKGGTLTVSTRLGQFLPVGDGVKKVESVDITFADTGIGIASDHLSHVFEPFFTTKEIGKGTGLGLSVSLGIVRNHQGDITVDSAGPGRGATFRVILPTSQSSAQGDPAGGQEAGFGAGANTRY